MGKRYNITPETVAVMRAYANVEPEIVEAIASNISSVIVAFEEEKNNIVESHVQQYYEVLEACKALFRVITEDIASEADKAARSAKKYEEILAIRIGAGELPNTARVPFNWRQSAAGGIGAELSEEEVRAQLMNAGKQWGTHLTDRQRFAIADYTNTAYVNINASLRGMTVFEQVNKERAIQIHEALKSARIPHDCTVYRGATKAALGQWANASDQELIGKLVIEQGFLSTSCDPENAFNGNTLLKIDVPAGAHGAYIGYLSTMGHYESEVLFDCQAWMKVKDVHTNEYGQKVVHMQMFI